MSDDMNDIDFTHDPALQSWVASANTDATDFPVQNLPFGRFRRGSESWRLGVAIGDQVLDLRAAMAAGLPLDATLGSDVLNDFAKLWPEKFSNKTNGVTPRRWVVLSNPRLAHCITQRIGEGWIRDLYELRKLEPLVDDPDFRAEWRQIKHANKTALAGLIEARTGVIVDPSAIFDVLRRYVEERREEWAVVVAFGPCRVSVPSPPLMATFLTPARTNRSLPVPPTTVNGLVPAGAKAASIACRVMVSPLLPSRTTRLLVGLVNSVNSNVDPEMAE